MVTDWKSIRWIIVRAGTVLDELVQLNTEKLKF
jgi:hypothetical protein